MLDDRRILAKIDELDAYLMELRAVAPDSFEEYEQIEKKRSCERLLQLCIQCVIVISRIMVSGLRLGLPADENDLFVKLQKKGIVSAAMASLLRQLRGFRNILVDEYASVDDELVFKYMKTRLADFENFKKSVQKFLKNPIEKKGEFG
jgi:uncharacterized protein YutE (UPF0331/DUF86 family)